MTELAELLSAHSVYASGSDLTYDPGDPRRYLGDGCVCGWRGPYGSRFNHQAGILDAYVAQSVRERLVEIRDRLAEGNPHQTHAAEYITDALQLGDTTVVVNQEENTS